MLKKNKDHHGRWRSNTVTFRASKEEIKKIDKAVALSGLSKQDYIITKLTNDEVVIVGNPKAFISLRKELMKIYGELLRLYFRDQIDNELLESIKNVVDRYDKLVEKADEDKTRKEKQL